MTVTKIAAVVALISVAAAVNGLAQNRAQGPGQRSAVQARRAGARDALHVAVERDDREAVRRLLAAGADANAEGQFGATPLWLAAQNGDAEMLEMLIKAGADPKKAVFAGETPVMTAARTGEPSALKVLLSHGADPNAREPWMGQTALMWAAMENNADAVRMLIEAGAQVSAVTPPPPVVEDQRGQGGDGRKGGLTALIFAAREGASDAITALLDGGANINQTEPDGICPLVVALLNGHYDAAGLLIQRGADVNLVDRTGRGPLFVAVDMHTLEARNDRPEPSSYEQLDAVDIVKMLLKSGAKVDAELSGRVLGPKRLAQGNTNLIKGSTPFLKAATTSDTELMRILLDAGADPFKTNAVGTNGLMMAAGLEWRAESSRGNQEQAIEAIKIFLERGLDVNAVNTRGETALHGAASRTLERPTGTLIEFLVEHGASRSLYTRTKAREAPGSQTGAAAAAQGPLPGEVTPYQVAIGGAANGERDPLGLPSVRPGNPESAKVLEGLMQKYPNLPAATFGLNRPLR
jgi:ankyrin repeat protein